MIPFDAEYGGSTKILHLLIPCDRFQTPFAFSVLSQVILSKTLKSHAAFL
jgi:hypothetical protein